MLIPVAMQEGKHVAATISELVRDGGASAFRYKDPGIMATIGRNSAVAELGVVHLSGFLGWLMWLAVHLVNVISFRRDRKSTRLNSSHQIISYAVFCLKK